MNKWAVAPVFLLLSIAAISATPVAFSQTSSFLGWKVLDGSQGELAIQNGTIRFWGNPTYLGGPVLYKDISPQDDFQISLQVKASQLGIAGPDGNLEGFGIVLRNSSAEFEKPHGADCELRGASGGMFLLARYTTFWQWTSFYGAYSSWGPPFGINSPTPSPTPTKMPPPPFPIYPTESVVKTGVWYTMKMSVQKSPFVVTGQVYAENGTLLGQHSISDFTNFKFEDIKCIFLANTWGGEFYVRNIVGLPPSPSFNYAPTKPAAHMPVVFDASNCYDPEKLIANYAWDFGDGTTNSSSQPTITHTYSSTGDFNVTLTLTDSFGVKASLTQRVHVYLPAYLSILMDNPTTVGSPINVNGKLTDYDGKGLTNELIVLHYTFAGAGGWLPVTSTLTDANGNYAIQWFASASGTFTLKTEWEGNETYAAAMNVSTLSSLPYSNQAVFFVESNSTVTQLAFNSTTSQLMFTVSGPSETTGFVKTTIAKSIIANAADIKAFMDGKALTYSVSSKPDAWELSFNYSHSTHDVSLSLGNNLTAPTTSSASSPANSQTLIPTFTSSPSTSPAIPEFPSFILFPFFMAIVLLGVLLYARLKKSSK